MRSNKFIKLFVLVIWLFAISDCLAGCYVIEETHNRTHHHHQENSAEPVEDPHDSGTACEVSDIAISYGLKSAKQLESQLLFAGTQFLQEILQGITRDTSPAFKRLVVSYKREHDHLLISLISPNSPPQSI
ncbi:hypothetical protein JNK13_01905 [bacterium]|nr:hypothetical protein [bacterium]